MISGRLVVPNFVDLSVLTNFLEVHEISSKEINNYELNGLWIFFGVVKLNDVELKSKEIEFEHFNKGSSDKVVVPNTIRLIFLDSIKVKENIDKQ